MKHTFILFTFLFIFITGTKAQTTVTSVKLNGNIVELTVTSDKAFYVGNNIHILHIGKTSFSHNKQSKKSLTFLIPESEFNVLADGETMWMSYGHKFNGQPSDEFVQQMAKENPNAVWFLSKFSKDLLKK
ncbi:MAG TPA: hypothetical protein VK177_08845 [Flavobacteriales bacterium]|nr:hypothetical protein [Flavobacteriales bacterium]